MNHLSMHTQKTLKCKSPFEQFWEATSFISTVFKGSLNMCLSVSMQFATYTSKSLMKVLKEMIIISSSCDVFCVSSEKVYKPVSNLQQQSFAFLTLIKKTFMKWYLWSSFLFFRTCWISHCRYKICLIRPLRQALAVSLSLNCFLRTETFITTFECLMIFHKTFLKCI